MLSDRFVQKLGVNFGNFEMVNRRFCLVLKGEFDVLVHVFGEEGDVRTHQDVDFVEYVEQYLQTHVLLAESKVSLHPGPIEAHVPIGEQL